MRPQETMANTLSKHSLSGRKQKYYRFSLHIPLFASQRVDYGHRQELDNIRISLSYWKTPIQPARGGS